MLDREPATHNWAAGFAAVPRAELVAVYDRADTTRQTFVDCWGAMPAFDDYAAMLVAIQPDIVCRKYLEAGRWARRQAGSHTGDVVYHPDTEGGPVEIRIAHPLVLPNEAQSLADLEAAVHAWGLEMQQRALAEAWARQAAHP